MKTSENESLKCVNPKCDNLQGGDGEYCEECLDKNIIED